MMLDTYYHRCRPSKPIYFD
uniref:Uncharacterized protein n=1 Tax=Rhizophora mucronata TaxID=61149 RepID=A0A2P2NAJ1_RHIMU